MDTVIKSVTQQTAPNSDLMEMMRVFTKMVNRCIRTGMKTHTSQIYSGIEIPARVMGAGNYYSF